MPYSGEAIRTRGHDVGVGARTEYTGAHAAREIRSNKNVLRVACSVRRSTEYAREARSMQYAICITGYGLGMAPNASNAGRGIPAEVRML